MHIVRLVRWTNQTKAVSQAKDIRVSNMIKTLALIGALTLVTIAIVMVAGVVCMVIDLIRKIKRRGK